MNNDAVQFKDSCEHKSILVKLTHKYHTEETPFKVTGVSTHHSDVLPSKGPVCFLGVSDEVEGEKLKPLKRKSVRRLRGLRQSDRGKLNRNEKLRNNT